jgi:hypothetical protein
VHAASSREETYARLLADAEAALGLLGVFVLGSRGRRFGIDDASDYDVAVIFADDASASRFERAWPYRHGADVEVLVGTIDGLRTHASFGSSSEWARYQYAHVEIVIDRTFGELAALLADKETIPDEERDHVVRTALGAYLNSTYRSLRYGTRLDAAESIPPLLVAIFGLEGRVRPFNKYFTWELEHHPLACTHWSADRLPGLVASVLDGETDAQHELFRNVEEVARAAGYGDEIDGWEPDLDWLRGIGDYRS